MKFRQLVVVVVGLLPGQAKRLAATCKGYAKLKCVDLKRASCDLPSGDRIVLLTSFINHAVQNQAYRHFSRSRVHRHSGGMKSVAGLVESLVRAEA